MADYGSFECPNFSIQELINFFKESNLEVTEKDFKSPNPRTWQSVFARIFQDFTSKPIDHVIQKLLLINKLNSSYQDHREEGGALMAFTLCMQRVFSACGYKDFNLGDIIQPTPNRLMKMTSCYLNMTRHSSARREYFDDVVQRIQITRDQSLSFLNKNKELKERHERAKDIQPLIEAEMEKKREELEQEKIRIIDLTKVQEEEKRLIEELKLKAAELTSDKEQIKQAMAQTAQEMDTLSRKVVKSPKRFQMEQERLKSKVQDLKNEFREKERHASETKRILEQTVNKLLIFQKSSKLAAEVTADTEKNNELDKQKGNLIERMSEKQEIFKVYFAREEDHMEKSAIRKEARNAVLNQVNMRKKSCSQQLEDLYQQKSKLEDETKSLKSDNSIFQGEIAVNSKRNEESEKIAEERKKDFQNKCYLLTQEINGYNEVLVQNVEKLSATLTICDTDVTE